MREPDDFPNEGIVCSLLCGDVLNCGHLCQLLCRYQCKHSSVCPVILQTKLPCGHIFSLMCGKVEAFKKSNCPANWCSKTLNCGHQCPLKCAQPCYKAKCEALIEVPNYSYPIKCFSRGVCAPVWQRPMSRQVPVPIPTLTAYRTFGQESSRRFDQDWLPTSLTTETGSNMPKESPSPLRKICRNIFIVLFVVYCYRKYIRK